MTTETADSASRSPAHRSSIRVVFDARSGRILEAHHGPAGEPTEPDEPGGAAKGDRAAITVPATEVTPGTRYRVDPTTRSLVVTDDELGVGFGAGPTGSAGSGGSTGRSA